MKRRRGFTVVEILIVLVIVTTLVLAAVIILNPMGLMGKAKDARRKSDLRKIRNAFEEYYNDKSGYPSRQPAVGKVSIVELMDPDNCGGSILQPWVKKWPCDPDGSPYKLSVEIVDDDNPSWYKVFTLLENSMDSDIPTNWLGGTYHVGNGEYGGDEVNYGTSSSNVNWYDYILDPVCSGFYAGCYRKDGSGNCLNVGGSGCVGDSCYTTNTCDSRCNVSCCGSGCD